jgi:hypothetical protein
MLVSPVVQQAVSYCRESWVDRPVAPPSLPSSSSVRDAVGKTAPDFTLRDLNDHAVHLRDLLDQSPVVIEFGSFS